jgi:hypothetical protein
MDGWRTRIYLTLANPDLRYQLRKRCSFREYLAPRKKHRGNLGPKLISRFAENCLAVVIRFVG